MAQAIKRLQNPRGHNENEIMSTVYTTDSKYLKGAFVTGKLTVDTTGIESGGVRSEYILRDLQVVDTYFSSKKHLERVENTISMLLDLDEIFPLKTIVFDLENGMITREILKHPYGGITVEFGFYDNKTGIRRQLFKFDVDTNFIRGKTLSKWGIAGLSKNDKRIVFELNDHEMLGGNTNFIHRLAIAFVVVGSHVDNLRIAAIEIYMHRDDYWSLFNGARYGVINTLPEHDEGMLAFWESAGDITLSTEGTGVGIKAHRGLLASLLPYFKGLTSGNFKDSTAQEISTPARSESALRTFLSVLYTGNVNLCPNDPHEVFEIVELFEYYGGQNYTITLLKSKLRFLDDGELSDNIKQTFPDLWYKITGERVIAVERTESRALVDNASRNEDDSDNDYDYCEKDPEEHENDEGESPVEKKKLSDVPELEEGESSTGVKKARKEL